MLLGIDIGGTTINLGLVKDNQIVHKITVPSFAPDATLEETLQHLEKAFNIPIAVNNDANCFVLGAAALLDKPSSVIAVVSCGQNVVKESMVHLFQTQNEKACRSGGGSSMSRMGLSGPLP